MFGKAYRLPFRLLGIPVLLDVSFLVILPLLAWLIGRNVPAYARLFRLGDAAERLTDGFTPYLLGLVAAIGLFISVVIHELGHAMVARAYHVPVKSITLWFLGGVAQFDEMPKQPGAEAVVAIVGPIVSFTIGLLCWLIGSVLPVDAAATRFVVHYLMLMNIVLAVFNLLPALPLDGGRVLRSLLALRLNYARATQIAASISKLLAILLGLWGLLTLNILMIAVAFFVYMAGTAETQATLISEMLRGIDVRDLMQRNVVSVTPQMPLAAMIAKMVQEHHTGFPVLDEAGQVVGTVGLRNVEGQDPLTPVSQIMSREVFTIGDNASAEDAFNLMSRAGFGRLVVVDSSNRMVGIITKADLMRAIQIRMAAAGQAGPLPASERDPLEPILHGR